MDTSIEIEFSTEDEKDLREFKSVVNEPSNHSLTRHVIELPDINSSRAETRAAVEEALEGSGLANQATFKLPDDVMEGAKSTFIATGGNVSEVAALYDLTPESVVRLAARENWPVYGGGTKVIQGKSKSQLLTLQTTLWRKLESMLDSLEVEQKKKDDIVQHRYNSMYVEPLSARSSAFKSLMDQYMRISTILEPELFSADPDDTNYTARKARSQTHPGGIEGVNREMADFFAQVVVGVADKIKERDLEAYGSVIDMRVE